MDKWVAIVPAKGHSDAVQRKNLQDLGGMPLFWHSVRYARAEGVEPVVSTDDPEIKRYAQERGCRVIDEVVDDSSMIHCVRQVLDQVDADRYVILQPTSPLREPGMLGRIVTLGAECAATVSRLKVIGMWQGEWRTSARRQEARDWFHYFDGSILTGSRSLAESGRLFTDAPQIHEQGMPWSLQVDSWQQLHIIRTIYDYMYCR